MTGKPLNPLAAPIGPLTRRRPLLTLKKKHFDDGGPVESRDVGVASVDTLGAGAISSDGGFLGSPEMGGARSDPGNPNNSSGLTAAQDAMANPSFGDHIGDALIGSRSLSFDPVTGTFTTERDYAGALARGAVGMMFGPLGPIVGLGMRAGAKYGTPIDDERVGRGSERGAGHADGGRVRMADGGVPPEVQAIIAQAMQRGGGQAPPPGPAAAPAGPPQPFRFIPDAKEMIRRYGGAAAPEALTDAALAEGGRPGTGSGLFRGPGDGRSDAIEAELEPEAFVAPADYVAAKGNGSTEAGAARIASEVIGNPDAAMPIPTVRGGSVPARVSSGEMYLDPADVERAGGHAALAADVRKTRKTYSRQLAKRKGPRR